MSSLTTDQLRKKFVPGVVVNIKKDSLDHQVTKVKIITEEEYNDKTSSYESSRLYLFIEYLDGTYPGPGRVNGLPWACLSSYFPKDVLQEELETVKTARSLSHWNTTCRFCGSQAYVGAYDLICSNKCCERYRI